MSHLPGITYTFSSTRGGLFWSKQVRHILGYTPERLTAEPFLWNRSIHPDDRQMVQDAIGSHAAGAEYRVEYRIQTAAGSWVWLLDCFVRKTVQDNEVIIDGFAIDITRRKNSEAENETLLREMRHRVKNNMSIVISLLSLQLNTVADAKARSVLNDTMSRLTSLQLLFDELHAGPLHSTVSIRDYLTRLVDHTTRLFRHGTKVHVEYALEDCAVEVKRLSSLGLIVNELLTNAMKYAFQDNPDPRLTVTGTRSGEDFVLTIADNGPGMNASVPGEESTGLGMTIVRALSEQIGARIQFEDAAGVTVRLLFPLSPSDS